MYGNEQAQYTLNRASYGEIPAGMMMGMRTTYGGAYDGINNMMSDVGRMVMPVSYTPPARVNVGFYGQYQQQTGFMSSMAGTLGFSGPGRSQMASDYMYNSASDFGERVGGGATGLATSVGGMGVGSLMGRFLGGGIVGGLAGSFAGMAAAGVVMDAVGQRREINNFLENSSYRYVSSGSSMWDSRRGGMNSQARSQVTDMVRGMDIKDPFMSTEDLTMILQQGTQKGLFTGTQDMGDFKKKFKDLTETVKVVARTLNQTLEESMHTIKELKSIGVDPNQASSVVGSAKMFGNMAGRTGGEMLNIGLQGAELFRGTGVNMGIGAQATMMNLATVRAARDAGQLSNEAVAQAGGEEALAMRMNASGLGFAQSTVGRGFGAAFMGAGGAFDQSKFMSMAMGGNYNLVGMAGMAAGNLSSPGALISYQANQAKFMSEMGKTFGGQGLQIGQMMTIGAQAQFLASSTNAKFEDAYRLSAKQEGRTDAQIDMDFAQMRGAVKINASANAAAHMEYSKNIIEGSYRSNKFVRAADKVADWGKSVVDGFVKPFTDMTDSIKESFTTFTEEEVYGIKRADASGIGLSRKIAGSRGTVLKVNSIDLTTGSLGAINAGERLNNALTGDMRTALGMKDSGSLIIKNPTGRSNVTADPDEIRRVAEKWGYDNEDLKRAQEKGVVGKTDVLATLFSKGITSSSTTDDLIKMAYGKGANGQNISKWQAMDLELSLKGTSLEHHVKDLRSVGSAASAAMQSYGQTSYISAIENYKAASAGIKSGMIGGLKNKNGAPLKIDMKGVSDETVQLIAHAAGLGSGKEYDATILKAESALAKEVNATPETVVKMVENGVKLKELGSNLATSQEHVKMSKSDIGKDMMSKMMVKSATESNLKNDQVDKIINAAKDIATTKNYKAFLAKTDEHKDALVMAGAGGARVRNTAAMIKRVDRLKDGDIAGLSNILQGTGITIDEEMRAGLNNIKGGMLQEKLLNVSRSSLASNQATTSAGGTAGDTSPEKVLIQQVTINESILQVMLGLEKRLR